MAEAPEPAALQERQIVIIVPEPKPKPHYTGPPFSATPHQPAGKVSSEPQYSFYLGVNTGPYQNFTNGTQILPPVPIEWIIAPLNVTDGQCHSRGDNLALFGVTNILVMVLALLTGCRPLVRWLTGGLLGKPSRWSPLWTWLISFGLQIGSNALISHLVVTTPGYQHLSMFNVFALYASRPRVNQLWLGSLRSIVGPVYLTGWLAFLRPKPEKKKEGKWWKFWKRKQQSDEEKTPVVEEKPPATTTTTTTTATPNKAYRYQYAEYVNWRSAQQTTTPVAATSTTTTTTTRARPTNPDPDPEPEWVYTDSYIATSVSEFFLQLVSAIFVGITWRRFPNVPIREHMKTRTNMMCAAPVLSLLGWLWVPIWWGRHKGWGNMRDPQGAVICWVIFFVGLTGFFTYGVAWLYWGEFLRLPGELWCPPKFVEQAAVWSSFSALSGFVGALL